MSSELGINLACWKFHIPGAINIDINKDCNPDIIADIRNLPFPNDSVDWAYFGHGAEHFHPSEYDRLFNEIKRVLRPGGKLIMTIPDTRKALDLVAKGEMDLGLLSQVVYGGVEDRPEQLHRSIFDVNIAIGVLKAYFRDVEDIGRTPYAPFDVPWQSCFQAFK